MKHTELGGHPFFGLACLLVCTHSAGWPPCPGAVQALEGTCALASSSCPPPKAVAWLHIVPCVQLLEPHVNGGYYQCFSETSGAEEVGDGTPGGGLAAALSWKRMAAQALHSGVYSHRAWAPIASSRAGAVAADCGAVPHGLPRLHHHAAGGEAPAVARFVELGFLGFQAALLDGLGWIVARQPVEQMRRLRGTSWQWLRPGARWPKPCSIALLASMPDLLPRLQAGADPSLRHPSSSLTPAAEAASYGEGRRRQACVAGRLCWAKGAHLAWRASA